MDSLSRYAPIPNPRNDSPNAARAVTHFAGSHASQGTDYSSTSPESYASKPLSVWSLTLERQ